MCASRPGNTSVHETQRARTLPHLLTADELTRFFRAIQDGGNVQHEILLKLLFFTAVRVGELVRIAVGAVDLAACKIFVDQGKGRKDRCILFPRAFGLVLRAHLAAHPKNHFVFETQRWGPVHGTARAANCAALSGSCRAR